MENIDIYGLKFNDNELSIDNKGITMSYPICSIHCDIKNENQFNNFILDNFEKELSNYDLIFMLKNDELLFRTFLYETGEKDDDGKIKLDTMQGEPTSIETRRILQGLENWNDAIDNIIDNKEDFKKVNTSKIFEKVKKLVNK